MDFQKHHIAISVPRFEYWLLCHFEDSPSRSHSLHDTYVAQYLPGYDRRKYLDRNRSRITLQSIRHAIRVASRSPQCTYDSSCPCSNVWKLVQAILGEEWFYTVGRLFSGASAKQPINYSPWKKLPSALPCRFEDSPYKVGSNSLLDTYGTQYHPCSDEGTSSNSSKIPLPTLQLPKRRSDEGTSSNSSKSTARRSEDS